MLGRGPGAVPCAHCTVEAAEESCPYCGLTICEGCRFAARCPTPRARRYRLGRDHRVEAFSPDGEIALVRRRNGRLWRFDLGTGTWLGWASALERHEAPAIALPGGYWLGHRFSGITIADELGDTVLTELDLKATARATGVSPGGRWITVACSDETIALLGLYPDRNGSARLERRVLRPLAGEVVTAAQFLGAPSLLVTATYGRLDCFRVRGHELEHRNSIRVPHRSVDWMAIAGSRGLALLAGGRRDDHRLVWFEVDGIADRLLGPVRTVWDQRGDTGLAGDRGPERPLILDLAPDGRGALLALDEGHLLVFDLEVGTVRRLIDHGSDLTAARLGSRMLVSADTGGTIIARPIREGRIISDSRREQTRRVAVTAGPASTACRHCDRRGTWGRCPGCQQPVCVQCARDWRGCPDTCGLDLDLPWGARVRAIDRSGRLAVVSRWLTGDRFLDLHAVSWRPERGPWSLARRVERALTRAGRYLRLDGATLSTRDLGRPEPARDEPAGALVDPLRTLPVTDGEHSGRARGLRLSTAESSVTASAGSRALVFRLGSRHLRRFELPAEAAVVLWDDQTDALFAGCGDTLVAVRDGGDPIASPLPGRCAWIGRAGEHLVTVVDPDDEPPLAIAFAVSNELELDQVAVTRCRPDIAVPAVADACADGDRVALTLVDGSVALLDPGSGATERAPAPGGRPLLVRILDDGALAIATTSGLVVHRWLAGARVERLAPMRVSGTVHR